MKTLRGRRGFTLLELLVVIGLMGVVSTLGTQLFFEMTDAWTSMRQRADLDAEADSAFRLIREDFEQLVSPRLAGVSLQGVDRSAQQDARYWGLPLNDDEMTFAVLAPVSGSDSVRAGLVRYRVERSDAEGLADVLRREVRDIGLPPEKAAGQTVALGVVRLELEYQAADGQWLPAWDRPELPEAVRASLAMSHPDSGEQVTRKAVFPVRVD